MTFKCDPAASGEEMRHRYERYEALACHLGQGIQDGIKAHNAHEAGHGFLPAAPEEITMSLVQAVVSHLKYDDAAVERFVELVRLHMSDDHMDFLDQL